MGKEDFKIPAEVSAVVGKLVLAGHEAYIVGGCVRDLLLGKKPKDWDVTTSARPEEILQLFEGSFYENKFLTVTVRTGSEDEGLKEVEVTTFRAEGKYTDKRHPDEVKFAKTLAEDLSRRDFTVNAIAMQMANGKWQIVDEFGGQEDLGQGILKAVGDPEKRLAEDALRMMRAVRLAVELGFKIAGSTAEAIRKLAGGLEFIARERIRDEFVKIVAADRARAGIEQLHELGLLRYIVPELEEGIGVENRPKIFTVWEHNLKAMEYGATHRFPIDVRVAALLHDAGKPRTKGPKKNDEWTFYGHDVVGARMALEVLGRLHFPRETVEKVATLIRWHLFKYDPDEGITDSSIRRLIRNVGPQNMDDLVKLRICDRMGMGVPKALPYRLRHFQFRVEKILREEEAPSVKMLKVKGDEIMQTLSIPPGPRVGKILEVLLQEVIDDPEKNNKSYLEDRVAELGRMSDEGLVKIAEEAENKVEVVESEMISSIKAKYYVK